jgi:hypothetical protein
MCCTWFCQCKKENNLPDLQPVNETWQALPDDIVDLNARNIITGYADSNNLMFFAHNENYLLDTAIRLTDHYSYNSPGYYSGKLQYKAGPRFRIYNSQDGAVIIIAANKNASSNSTSSLTALEASGVAGNISCFTAPDEQDDFYVAIITGQVSAGDKTFVVCKYHLTQDGPVVTKNLIWNKTLVTDVTTPEESILSINAVDDIVFVTTLDRSYRMQNGLVTDSTVISLRDVVKSHDVYYATCSWRATAQQEYPEGLVYSIDKGRNWQYIGRGTSFSLGQLLSRNDKLFLNTGSRLSYIDVERKAVTPLLSYVDIHGPIRTIHIFREKVYAGTDAGVYYKSLKGFLQPQ